jgi:outer membrane lipoprotein SlyB
VNVYFADRKMMKKYLAVMFAGLALISGSANAAGCLKGAAVGGIAGHVAGHHAVLGAVGGCVVGRHLAKKQAKQEKESAQAQKAPPVPAK